MTNYAYSLSLVKPILSMKTESIIRILVGIMVLTSISLAHWVNEKWLFLAAFVGINLIQSVFTGFCPAATIIEKLGLGDAACCTKPSAKK